MHILSRIDRLRAHALRWAGLATLTVPSAAVSDEDTEAWSKEAYEADLEDESKRGLWRLLTFAFLGALLTAGVMGAGVARADVAIALTPCVHQPLEGWPLATAIIGGGMCVAFIVWAWFR
jgi:hypothetical protein